MGEIGLKSCTKCKHHLTCTNICVQGVGSKKSAEVMLVFDYPSSFDDKNETVVGNVPILDQVLYDVIKFDKATLYKTYALKCRPKEGKAPTKKELNICKEFLLEEINVINPKVIVTFGEVAMEAITGLKKVGKYRGQTQIVEFENKRIEVICTYSPYYIMNATENLTLWASDIYKAYNIANDIEESVSSTEVVYCDTFSKVKTAVEYCKIAGIASFDFETPKIDTKGMGVFKEGHHATMLSLTFQTGSAYAIPLEHIDSPYTKDEVLEIMEYLKVQIFENPKVRKIAHNLDYDYHVAAIYGIECLRGRIDDTMLMGHLVDETKPKGLKMWVKELFPEFGGYEDELEAYGWSKVPIKKLAQYNGTDTDMTFRLAMQLERMLQEDVRSYIIYRNLTMAAFRHIWKAEREGMDINRAYLSESVKEVQSLLSEQEKKLLNNPVVKRYCIHVENETKTSAIAEAESKLNRWRELHKNFTKTEARLEENLRNLKSGKVSAYKGFNFKSVPQMRDLMFRSPLGFKFPSFTESTNKDDLKDLVVSTDAEKNFIDGLMLYRTIDIILKTFLVGIYTRLDKNDRVHTSLLLSGTVTGRLSSRNPNLQNIPSMAKLSNEIAAMVVSKVKKSFSVPQGYKLLQGDYSQAELRIISEFAKEATMLKVYENDGDVHAMTASNMMGVPFEDFYDLDPKEQKSGRQKAKAANFGLIYKISVKGFMEYAKNNYGVVFTYAEAEKVVDDFFDLYPKLLEYHDTYIAKGRKYGWVRTLFGRRRRLPDIHHPDDYKREADERVAVNSPVQGTAGEFTIFAIALLEHRLHSTTKFRNTVHDSIVFYVLDELFMDETLVIKNTMENLPIKKYFGKELKRVKMKADFEFSETSWGDLKPVNF